MEATEFSLEEQLVDNSDESFENIVEDGTKDMQVEHDSCAQSYDVIKPYVGVTFETELAAYDYYNMYARLTGFFVRKLCYHRLKKETTKIINRKLVCSKQGQKEFKRSRATKMKQKREVRDGCLAHLYVSERKDGKWEVRQFVEEHTHLLASPSKVMQLRSHKEITDASKEVMYTLHTNGVGPSVIVKALNYSGERSITAQQCIDELRGKRKSTIGKECINVISYFQTKMNSDPGFFHRWEVDEDDVVMNFFWADGRARESYMTFGDVVVFDSTYRTNKFLMPFAPFTGINHHRRSCLFG